MLAVISHRMVLAGAEETPMFPLKALTGMTVTLTSEGIHRQMVMLKMH